MSADVDLSTTENVLQCQWVEVVDEVVRHATEIHHCAHTGQIVRHLIVSQPVERHPEEDLAGTKTTCDLINPDIVDSLQERWRAITENGGLHAIPEIGVSEVAIRCDRVWRPAALAGQLDKLESLSEHGFCGRSQLVVLLANKEDDWCKEEHEGGKGICEPETDVLLGVYHTDT